MSEGMTWGPDNPHPFSRLKTELIWEGKYDEYGRRREVSLPNFPLAMQRIETIDEPRDSSRAQGSLFDEQTAHRDDFRNRLIWGDNKLALMSLLSEFRASIQTIYIDPPFDVGTDFSVDLALGEESDSIDKENSLLETVAYRDMWGKGTDSYLHVMYERISLMRELLTSNGSFFVQCDWRMTSLMRGLLDEIFGKENFQNEIYWYYYNKLHGARKLVFPRATDTIFYYVRGRSEPLNFRHITEEREKPVTKLKYHFIGGKIVNDKGEDGKAVTYESTERQLDNVWKIRMLQPADKTENVGYATQKPEELSRRILESTTNEGDLVADFFCGSGTLLAVAEKMGRKWIGTDLGRYSIHTARKRLIGVQRDLYSQNLPYRSFDLYNLGRYERQWWQLDRLKGANEEHRATVLKFFRAQPLTGSPSSLLHATKTGSFVHVDDIDSLLTLQELDAVAKATSDAGGRSLICLAWEFQMDLKMKAQALEAKYDLKIALKYIPREIMEPNRTEVHFFEAAALEADAVVTVNGKEKAVDVKLTRFIPSLSEVPEKELLALRERAVNSPFDFIDFWAIDFEHREDKPFEHHWQDYRTRKDRKLLIESNCRWKYATPGTKLIRIKVIDVFGIDTTKVIEVTV